jgi:hypothetical protein
MNDRWQGSKAGGDVAEALLELADQLGEQGRDLLRQAKEVQKLAHQLAGREAPGPDRPAASTRDAGVRAQRPSYGAPRGDRSSSTPGRSGQSTESRPRSPEFRPRQGDGGGDRPRQRPSRSGAGDSSGGRASSGAPRPRRDDRGENRSRSAPGGARRGGERGDLKAPEAEGEWRTVEAKPRASDDAGRAPVRKSRPGDSRGGPRGGRTGSGFSAEGEWRGEGTRETRGERPSGGGNRPPSKGGSKKPGWVPKGGRKK